MYINPFETITNITLYLGLKCDNNCIYCRDKIFNHHPETDDKITIIDKLVEKFKRLKHFTIIGGEPFCYWKILKPKLYQYADRISYGFFTNGYLLEDPDIYDSILNDSLLSKKLKISLVLSHDGPNTKITRCKDPFDSEKVLKLIRLKALSNELAINTVIPQYNNDIDNTYNFFKNKVISPFNWRHIYLYGFPEMSKMIDIKLYEDSLYKFISKWKYDITANIYLKNYISYFFLNISNINIIFSDVDGNFRTDSFIEKHNGNIFDDDFIEKYNIFYGINKSNKNPRCWNCELFGHCSHSGENCNPYTKKLSLTNHFVIERIMKENGFSDPIKFNSYILNYDQIIDYNKWC